MWLFSQLPPSTFFFSDACWIGRRDNFPPLSTKMAKIDVSWRPVATRRPKRGWLIAIQLRGKREKWQLILIATSITVSFFPFFCLLWSPLVSQESSLDLLLALFIYSVTGPSIRWQPWRHMLQAIALEHERLAPDNVWFDIEEPQTIAWLHCLPFHNNPD